jgi:hypothetical protein
MCWTIRYGGQYDVDDMMGGQYNMMGGQYDVVDSMIGGQYDVDNMMGGQCDRWTA